MRQLGTRTWEEAGRGGDVTKNGGKYGDVTKNGGKYGDVTKNGGKIYKRDGEGFKIVGDNLARNEEITWRFGGVPKKPSREEGRRRVGEVSVSQIYLPKKSGEEEGPGRKVSDSVYVPMASVGAIIHNSGKPN